MSELSYSLHDSSWSRFGGLRSFQIVAIVVAAVVGLLIVAAGYLLVGLLAMVVVGTVGLTARVAGVPLPALSSPVCAWLVTVVRRRRCHELDLFGSGLGWSDSLPAWLGGLEPFDVQFKGRHVRLVWDRKAGELSAVFALSGSGFSSSSSDEQRALLAQWERYVGPLGESGLVTRVGWQHWSPPWSDSGHRRWRDGLAGGGCDSSRDDYDRLVAAAAENMFHREVVLVVTGSVSRLRQGTIRAGQLRVRLAEQLLDLVASHSGGLGSSLRIGPALGPVELTTALRQRIDPTLSRRDQSVALSAAAGRSAPSWGVMASEERFGAGVAVDQSTHRTYWVANWPQRRLGPDWVETIVAGKPGLCQTTSVVFEPVSRQKAEAQENRRGTSTEADVGEKQKRGFRLRARDRTAGAEVQRREDALAGGQSLVLTSCFVTVSSDSWEGLEQDCREVLAAIGPVDLWPMAGRFGPALVTALPLGRSVRSRSLN